MRDDCGISLINDLNDLMRIYQSFYLAFYYLFKRRWTVFGPCKIQELWPLIILCSIIFWFFLRICSRLHH